MMEVEQWFGVIVGLAGNELSQGEKIKDFPKTLLDKVKTWAGDVVLVNNTVTELLITKNSNRFGEFGLFVSAYSREIADKINDLYLCFDDPKIVFNKWDNVKSDVRNDFLPLYLKWTKKYKSGTYDDTEVLIEVLKSRAIKTINKNRSQAISNGKITIKKNNENADKKLIEKKEKEMIDMQTENYKIKEDNWKDNTKLPTTWLAFLLLSVPGIQLTYLENIGVIDMVKDDEQDEVEGVVGKEKSSSGKRSRIGRMASRKLKKNEKDAEQHSSKTIDKVLEIQQMNASQKKAEFQINSLRELIDLEDSPSMKKKYQNRLKNKLADIAECSPPVVETASNSRYNNNAIVNTNSNTSVISSVCNEKMLDVEDDNGVISQYIDGSDFDNSFG